MEVLTTKGTIKYKDKNELDETMQELLLEIHNHAETRNCSSEDTNILMGIQFMGDIILLIEDFFCNIMCVKGKLKVKIE